MRPSLVYLSLAQLQRYGLAVLLVAAGIGAIELLEKFGFRPATGMLMMTVVALNSWYQRRGPALLSLILALLAMNYFFIEPRHSFKVTISELPYYVIFTSCATIFWWFSMVRRRLEHDLRQTRNKLEVEVEERSSLLDLTHDTISVLDMEFVIKYWNRGAAEFYGWTQQDAVGKRSDELLHTIFPKPVDEIRAELLEKDQWQGELTRTKADGDQAVISSRWSLRRDQQHRPIAILETSNDITARKRWEEEIQALNQELAKRSMALETSNKDLEAFAYTVSHDLRAPLRHMAGFTELLRKNVAASLNEKSQRYLAIILEVAARMGNLIDDLLRYSRISRTETKKSKVDLNQLVREVVAEVREDVKERNIVWKIDSLPTCYGDRAMLRIALVNLISNAVKFTRPRQQAEIEIGSTNQDSGDPLLFVRDNGVGFNMKYSNKLFGVFQRLHPKNTFEGTGIGLATVQRIVSGHGGRIWADSEVDRGTTFYFSIPEIKEL